MINSDINIIPRGLNFLQHAKFNYEIVMISYSIDLRISELGHVRVQILDHLKLRIEKNVKVLGSFFCLEVKETLNPLFLKQMENM